MAHIKQFNEFVLSKRYNGIKGHILLYALAAKLEIQSFGNHHGSILCERHHAGDDDSQKDFSLTFS